MFLSSDSSQTTINYYQQFIEDGSSVSQTFSLFTIISPIIVVVTFIISQLISESNRKKEVNRNWYFKAHLEGSINKTENFLNKSSELVENYASQIKSIDKISEDFLICKAKNLDDLKDLIRRFEFEVINPLKILYPNTFQSSLSELQEFQDLLTTLFDSDQDSKLLLNNWFEIKGTIRAQLLDVLSRPVITKKKSFFNSAV